MVDFAIIGAGPAGMAAALLAAELGLDTLLVDEQPAPGRPAWLRQRSRRSSASTRC